MLPEHIQKDVVTFEDGFKYYWPEGSSRGGFSAAHLRFIADELDKQNAAWREEIDRTFRLNETTPISKL